MPGSRAGLHSFAHAAAKGALSTTWVNREVGWIANIPQRPLDSRNSEGFRMPARRRRFSRAEGGWPKASRKETRKGWAGGLPSIGI